MDDFHSDVEINVRGLFPTDCATCNARGFIFNDMVKALMIIISDKAEDPQGVALSVLNELRMLGILNGHAEFWLEDGDMLAGILNKTPDLPCPGEASPPEAMFARLASIQWKHEI